MPKFSVIFFSCLAISGCAGRWEANARTTVTQRFSAEFECAPEQIEVQLLGSYGEGGPLLARGCGQQQTYECGGGGTYCTLEGALDNPTQP